MIDGKVDRVDFFQDIEVAMGKTVDETGGASDAYPATIQCWHAAQVHPFKAWRRFPSP